MKVFSQVRSCGITFAAFVAIFLAGCFGNGLYKGATILEQEHDYIQRMVWEKKCDFGALVALNNFKDHVTLRIAQSGLGARIGEKISPDGRMHIFCIQPRHLTGRWLEYKATSEASWPVYESLPYNRGTVYQIELTEKFYNLNDDMNPQLVYDIYMYGEAVPSSDTTAASPPR